MTVRLAVTPDGRWEHPTTELAAAPGAAGFSALGINADGSAADAYAAGPDCHEVL